MKNRAILLFQLIVVLGVFSSIMGKAQIANVNTDFAGRPLELGKLEGPKGVEGSPFLTSEWRTGTLIYDNKKIVNVQMRYNAFEDCVQIMNNNQPFIPDERLVSGFEFTNVDGGTFTSYNFKNGFEGDGIEKDNYLNVIYQGDKVVLAQRFKADQISVTPATYGERNYKQFALSKNYVLVKDGVAKRFKPSKKAFSKEFPELAGGLKEFFKENNINFSNYDDLARVAGFIDGRSK